MENSENKSVVSLIQRVKHRIMNPPKHVTAGKPFGVYITLMKIYFSIAMIGAAAIFWTRNDAKKNRAKQLKLREQLTLEVMAELAEEKRVKKEKLARLAEEQRLGELKLAALKQMTQ